MEKIRLIYLTLILFCCCQLSAQNKTVTGQVYVQTKDILVRLCLRTFFLMVYSLSLKLKTI